MHATLLPHGLYDADGACHRDAELRPLTGREERLLAEAAPAGASGALGAEGQTALLAACLARLGGYAGAAVDGALVAQLTRGDRQHLALHLRAQLYGERLLLVARCLAPACGALADVDADIAALAPERPAPAPEHLRVALPEGTATLREPTGEDDAALEASGLPRAGRAALLWSRLVELDGAALTPGAWAALPARSRHALALALAEGGSAPDLVLLSRCPECGAWLELALEPFALLARELRGGAGRLDAELHCLAFHYHWSEDALLALPRPRRWRYLELLRRELEGRPLLDGGP